MRRVLLVVSTIIPVAALAACASPTGPAPAFESCRSGKIPYGSCANGDFINPLGDFINPLGDDTTKTKNGGH